MDIGLLKTFIEVNKTRHFGKAAENLFITQSAVSARIQLLEEQLGVKLFSRSRNNIQLTPAGQRFLPHAEAMLNTWLRASQDMALQENQKTLLSISCDLNLWDNTLQNWLHTLYRSMPEIAFNVQIHRADSLRRKILDGAIDLALTFDPPQLEEFSFYEINLTPLILVAAQAGQASLEHLPQHYVAVDWGSSYNAAFAKHFPAIRTPVITLAAEQLALQFLLAGEGIAYLSKLTVAEHLATGRLHRIEDAPLIPRFAAALFETRGEQQAVIEQALTHLPVILRHS